MEANYLLSHGALRIPCRLYEPDFGSVRRVILGVHGFGGSSLDQIQAGIAEEMGIFGAATVRFDFPGHGENPLSGKDFTLENCVCTLLAAAQHAKERFPQVEDLCIFASGFGAYVTLLALQELLELPGRIKLVVQTPSLHMHDTLLSMIGLSAQTLAAMGHYTLRAERPLLITSGFYEELRANTAIAPYPIPILILQGEADAYVNQTDVQHFHRINERSKLVTIPGASHRFLEPGAWDMVLDLTRDWFEYEQVLLSDYT